MTLLCQDRDHSKPCTVLALLLIKQACKAQIVNAGLQAEIREGRGKNEQRSMQSTRMKEAGRVEVPCCSVNMFSGAFTSGRVGHRVK